MACPPPPDHSSRASKAPTGGASPASARPRKARNLLSSRPTAEARGPQPGSEHEPTNRPAQAKKRSDPGDQPRRPETAAGDGPPTPPAKPAPPAPHAAANPVKTAAELKQQKLFQKQVFTTGEAAEVCKVSQQTIIRCFDAGRLQGFRVPGSRFRRIPREDLIRFMKDNDIPTDGFGTGKKRVLIVDDDPNIVELWMDVLRNDARLELRSALTGYDAGIVSSTFKPELMILDYMLPDINGNVVCQTVRANDQLKDMKIIIVSGVVKQEEIDQLLMAGADEFIKKPIDLDQLMQRVEDLLEL